MSVIFGAFSDLCYSGIFQGNLEISACFFAENKASFGAFSDLYYLGMFQGNSVNFPSFFKPKSLDFNVRHVHLDI